MNATRLLRPAHHLLSTTIVAGVAVACLMSPASGTTVPDGHGDLTVQDWTSSTSSTSTGSPGRTAGGSGSEGPVAIALVAASASPSMSAGRYESLLLRRINTVRTGRNLPALRPASCPERAASRWSSRMASTGDFRHQSMRQLLRTCNATYAGETLGRGRISPRTLVSMWMRSTPHRRILLSSSPRRIGLGATPNARGEWVVTADFVRL